MKKPSNINQRIVHYCKISKIKQVDIIRAGIASKQTTNNIWHERHKPSCEFLEKFADYCIDVNMRWILTGVGEILDRQNPDN